MGKQSGIEWTDHTFNPWWGCTHAGSPGCDHCYAREVARRFSDPCFDKHPRRTFGKRHWNEPRRWNRAAERSGKRAKVFVGSMCDVLEEGDVQLLERERLLWLIDQTPHLDWLLLSKRPEGMPVQPAGGAGIRGTVEIFPEYEEGLKDLDGFSHVILLYHFHRSEGFKMRVVPYMDSRLRGLFATRAPKRPNPIGLSLVGLRKIEGAMLHIENVDILDGTPLLDIKPYVPEFDRQAKIRTGWLEEARKAVSKKRSDKRFS